MKSINEPIAVDARKGVPCRFRWDRRIYQTRKLLDYWILQTRWWGGEERRIYFRLLTDRGVMEIYRTTSGPSREEIVRLRDGGSSDGARLKPEGKVRRERPPLPIEGDTHTRERRRTDAVYRPDVRWEEASRGASSGSASADASPGAPSAESSPGSCSAGGSGHSPFRWMLSKIVD